MYAHFSSCAFYNISLSLYDVFDVLLDIFFHLSRFDNYIFSICLVGGGVLSDAELNAKQPTKEATTEKKKPQWNSGQTCIRKS